MLNPSLKTCYPHKEIIEYGFISDEDILKIYIYKPGLSVPIKVISQQLAIHGDVIIPILEQLKKEWL